MIDRASCAQLLLTSVLRVYLMVMEVLNVVKAIPEITSMRIAVFATILCWFVWLLSINFNLRNSKLRMDKFFAMTYVFFLSLNLINPGERDYILNLKCCWTQVRTSFSLVLIELRLKSFSKDKNCFKVKCENA